METRACQRVSSLRPLEELDRDAVRGACLLMRAMRVPGQTPGSASETSTPFDAQVARSAASMSSTSTEIEYMPCPRSAMRLRDAVVVGQRLRQLDEGVAGGDLREPQVRALRRQSSSDAQAEQVDDHFARGRVEIGRRDDDVVERGRGEGARLRRVVVRAAPRQRATPGGTTPPCARSAASRRRASAAPFAGRDERAGLDARARAGRLDAVAAEPLARRVDVVDAPRDAPDAVGLADRLLRSAARRR